ncbi:hypothetical protein CK203_042874 [Vitis vinifera]|uniref:Uncharacterized protein n=1 Tax=Vitis vinifera TaxID=29760 RepID=A0A438HUM3_VITVI|nr:hypothetical protein CK203_042874 [Vitis vinifera]
MGKEAEYFSKDFEWEKLKEEVESNPSLSYHFQTFDSNSPSLPSPSKTHKHGINFTFVIPLADSSSQKDENNDGLGKQNPFDIKLGISVLFICFLNTEMM